MSRKTANKSVNNGMLNIRGLFITDNRASVGKPDIAIIVIVAVMLIYGCAMSYSAGAVYAEQHYGDELYFLKKYILFAVLSIALTFPFVIYTTIEFWKRFAVISYIASLILLLLVLFIGHEGGGAQRWIEIGSLTIQPSEITKMAVVLFLSLYMSDHENDITVGLNKKRSFVCGVVMPAVIFGSACALVALEKHISGLMIIGMIGIAVMFTGGTKIKYILWIIASVLGAGILLVLVSEYAQQRVETWLFIEKADPLGSAWQTWQGLFAIGSGGFFGKGFGNSLQKYGYISQPQNDFVFTVICEELGFVGALVTVLLFAFLFIRGLNIASRMPDKFSSMVVSGLSFKITLQAILNIAVVTNSMPNTGVSLPFFSSGGTSLAVQIFEVGIILSLSRYCVHQ